MQSHSKYGQDMAPFVNSILGDVVLFHSRGLPPRRKSNKTSRSRQTIAFSDTVTCAWRRLRTFSKLSSYQAISKFTVKKTWRVNISASPCKINFARNRARCILHWFDGFKTLLKRCKSAIFLAHLVHS